MTNKKYLFFVLFLLKGLPPFQKLDFEPAFLQRFCPILSPRSIFPSGQRFLLPNHVTSGCMSPRSFFPTGQRFLLPNHVTSGCMSPRSFFPLVSGFPLLKTRDFRFHEPTIHFSNCSAVSPPKNT